MKTRLQLFTFILIVKMNAFAGMPCTSPPSAGSITSSISPLGACPGTQMTLTHAGFSTDSGITKTWQVSSNGINWNTFVNTLTTRTITTSIFPGDSIFYRVGVKCFSGASEYATIKVVNTNNLLDCYCISAAQVTEDEDILNVTFAGINNTSDCSTTLTSLGSIKNRYANYTTIVTPGIITQGETQTFSYQIGTCQSNYFHSSGIFIDFNRDGDFSDTLEQVYASSIEFGAKIFSGFIAVPKNAAVGITRLRVVCEEVLQGSLQPAEACGLYGFGETEDYLIQVNAAPNCGTVNTPIITASLPQINSCPRTPIILYLNGNTNDIGTTIIWEESKDTIIWQSINENGTILQTMAPSNSNDSIYYRVGVNCNGGVFSYSNAYKIKTSQNIENCYCLSIPNTNLGINLLNVKVGGKSISDSSIFTPIFTGCTLPAPGVGSVLNKYSNYMLFDTIVARQSEVLQFGFLTGQCLPFTNILLEGSVYVFIDFNQNGSFEDENELIIREDFLNNAYVNINNAGYIPVDAKLGYTRMRVIAVSSYISITINSCSQFEQGEIEDYTIQIIPPLPCNVLSKPTIDVQNLEACLGGVATVNVLTYPAGGNISYGWEQSFDGIAWASVNDSSFRFAVFVSQDSIFYRFGVRCFNSTQTVYSDAIRIVALPFYQCMCDDNLGKSNCFAKITKVSIVGTSINNVSSCNNGYENFFSTNTNNTDSLGIGKRYTMNLNIPNANKVIVWIDFNHSGTYDFNESFKASISLLGINKIGIIKFKIPITALKGPTAMRIRALGGSNSFFDSVAACKPFNNGETEDYVVYLVDSVDLTNNINKKANQAFLLYPNPTTGKLIIDLNKNIEEIIFYNVTGQKVKKITKDHTEQAIDISDLVNGTYMIQIITQNSILYNKVLLQKEY